MYGNYLKVAIRNLLKNRFYNLVNIGGLAVGLASCVLIMLFVVHELSYDEWIPEKDRVYRAQSRTAFPGAPENDRETIPPVVAGLMAEQLDELELSTRLISQNTAMSVAGRAFQQGVSVTDPDVFEMFGITLIEGDKATALDAPDAIVLDERSALRMFGTTAIVGETIKVNGQHLFKVTGVMPNWPELSDLDVEALVPFSTPIINNQPWLKEHWGSYAGVTYVKVRLGVGAEGLAEAFNTQARRVAPDWIYKRAEEEGRKPPITFFFTPAVDAHLQSDQGTSGERGSVQALWGAAIVAFLILAIAVMNMTNLGTMLALKRVREVAIRKSLGAAARQLVIQILVESIAVAMFAMVVGIVLVEAFLPAFADMMGRPLTTAPLYAPQVIAPIFLFTVVIGCVSGLYPALVAARFRPVDHLNGIAPTVGIRFRNALMVVQFAATIGLLVTCFVVFAQARYAQARNPGFDSSQLVKLSGIDTPLVLEQEQTLRDALARIPGVEAVTASHIAPGDGYNNSDGGSFDGGPRVSLKRISVSEEFFSTMGIKALVGRIFSPDRLGDRLKVDDRNALVPVLINETASRQLGAGTPSEALDRIITTGRQLLVVGVVDDLKVESARTEVRPSYFLIDPREFRHVILRVSRSGMPDTLSAIDRAWRELFPDVPVQRQFLDEAFAEYYDAERRRGWLLLGSAIVMIVVATTGLFALSALTTERRAREIGIRKVLGARTGNIVNLLLWQFSKPVLIANLIAWPIAWMVLQGWLEAFVDHVALTPLPFIGAGLLVLTIAGATIVGQVAVLASANPIKALRYE